MNRLAAPHVPALSLVVLVTLTTGAPAQHHHHPDPTGDTRFRTLFNGKDLEGWWGLGTEDPRVWQALPDAELETKRSESLDDVRAHWRVENGELVNDGAGAYLTTLEEFADFELLAEYKTVAGADSGLYLRGIPQVQIWDTTEAGGKWPLGADKGSGGLWNNTPGAPGRDPLVHADAPFGAWNRVFVRMIGERVSVWLNRELVVDHARLENYFERGAPLPRRGPLQLQTHGGEIRWRRLFVRDIEPGEANARLSEHGADGYRPIFDGKSLAGWSGAVDGWEIHHGILRCKPENSATLFTEATYGDFAARLEFRLPPGGNNGLAIRYPGSGDSAYVGLCELQVLDDSAPMHADLDPRQYHGSAYGQVAAHRGYLREVGQWNFQDVRVVGTRVTVELNGTRILDADLADVSDFLHPAEQYVGRTRTEGHFGFAGHGDPVEFRAVRVREL